MPTRDDLQIHCSRRAADSTDEPMEMTFSMRLPHDLRILGGRKARLMGLTLSEYMRHLLAKAVDSDVDTVLGEPRACVLRKGEGDEA